MITPIEIKKKAEYKYLSFLRTIVEGKPFEPIVIAGNKKPSDDTVTFDKELTELINRSKEKLGYGYSVEYQKVKTKKHGEQDIPVSISFPTEHDFLKFIGREQDTINFRRNVENILSKFPTLTDWICKYPNKVLDNCEVWGDLLKVCKYFMETPKPQLYIRELPIRVHTKFIERKKDIIKELLEFLIPEVINEDEKRFERRFNLKYDEPLVRFRILDKKVGKELFSCLEDLSIPISQFSQLDIPISKVYIVENKMNMLTFPYIESSIVIWGHGFGVDIMKDVEWLHTKRIYYWGDLDAQGFQILSEFRTYFSHVESFLMDKETFDQFSENDKGTITTVEKNLHLTREEHEIYAYLKENNLRLEQEKIPFEYASERIP